VREEKKFFIIAHDEGHCKGKKVAEKFKRSKERKMPRK
jgi:hypothetical protein